MWSVEDVIPTLEMVGGHGQSDGHNCPMLMNIGLIKHTTRSIPAHVLCSYCKEGALIMGMQFELLPAGPCQTQVEQQHAVLYDITLVTSQCFVGREAG